MSSTHDQTSEFDVHDVLNIFQVTEPADGALHLSRGDLSAWGWGEGGAGEEGEKKSMLDCCRPIKVEVFKITDESILEGWKEFESPKYRGMHGMKVPLGEGAESEKR
ncbi:hypothetical protein H2203_001861 [Taxawa tesnikishii (nom. ined.)]|nr:hypothetical protein H2203_001861 [Dothideales sp. JES 119]